jgi:hypothetical protein
MRALPFRRRTLVGQDIWLADSDAPDRERLAAQVLESLGLPAEGWSLGHDALGRPLLLDSAGAELPARLSFSRLGKRAEANGPEGRQWAAAMRAEDAAGLGLDVAAPEEFAPPYPVARAFAPEELAAAHGSGLAGQDALALLWSLKEAAAKALGTGFHRVEPLELCARNFRQTPEGLACEVHGPVNILPALAERLPCGWLALALLTDTGVTP